MARWRPRTDALVQDVSRRPPPCQEMCRRRVGLPLLTCDPIGIAVLALPRVADGPVETVASSSMTHGVGSPMGLCVRVRVAKRNSTRRGKGLYLSQD